MYFLHNIKTWKREMLLKGNQVDIGETQHIVKDYSEGGAAIKSGHMHTYSAVIWDETIKFQRYQQV